MTPLDFLMHDAINSEFDPTQSQQVTSCVTIHKHICHLVQVLCKSSKCIKLLWGRPGTIQGPAEIHCQSCSSRCRPDTVTGGFVNLLDLSWLLPRYKPTHHMLFAMLSLPTQFSHTSCFTKAPELQFVEACDLNCSRSGKSWQWSSHPTHRASYFSLVPSFWRFLCVQHLP